MVTLAAHLPRLAPGHGAQRSPTIARLTESRLRGFILPVATTTRHAECLTAFSKHCNRGRTSIVSYRARILPRVFSYTGMIPT
jgi:hypothetical protein